MRTQIQQFQPTDIPKVNVHVMSGQRVRLLGYFSLWLQLRILFIIWHSNFFGDAKPLPKK
jgi:hypothetical protein